MIIFKNLRKVLTVNIEHEQTAWENVTCMIFQICGKFKFYSDWGILAAMQTKWARYPNEEKT